MAQNQGELQQFLGSMQRIVRDSGSVSLRTAAQNAMAVGGDKSMLLLRGLSQALSMDRINRNILLAVHQQLARDARQQTIAAYQARNPRRTVPPYRQEHGRIGYGVTLSALRDGGHEGMSTAFRVQPFDFDLLDALTSRGELTNLWRQLNFGALPNSGRGPAAFQVVLPNGGGFTLQLPNQPVPAGVLKRPKRGIFVDGNGKRVPFAEGGDDRFQPLRGAASSPMVPLRGSKATQFMDAASESLAKGWGPAYQKMYRSLLTDAQQKARLQRGGVQVPKGQGVGTARTPQIFVVKVK